MLRHGHCVLGWDDHVFLQHPAQWRAKGALGALFWSWQAVVPALRVDGYDAVADPESGYIFPDFGYLSRRVGGGYIRQREIRQILLRKDRQIAIIQTRRADTDEYLSESGLRDRPLYDIERL